jgi:hypothetical protein
MWFVRIAFVLGVAAYLLPREPEQQARLEAQTRAAIVWAVTFCDRNATPCAAASEVWTAALAKGELAVTGAVRTYSGWMMPLPVPDAPPQVRKSNSVDHGTLSETDRIPAWRGVRTPR